MKTRLETYLRFALSSKENLRIQEFHRINQGNSNEMAAFTLRWREGGSTLSREYILRMPPEKGIMYPYSPSREYRLLKALKTSPVPVPGVLLLEEDESILGKPFLIMEKVRGDTLSFAYHALSRERKKRLSREYASTLADIHSTDWREPGLFPDEAPGDAAQFADTELRKCRDKLEGIHGIPRQMLEDALGRLDESRPHCGELALIHGDYNIGNVLFSGNKIVAVLDWETACIGDPALDLGWLYPGGALALGLPMDREDFITLYRQGGGKNTDNLPFYQALAIVKLTTVCIHASLSLDQERRGESNLSQMGFTIPYILNSLCYLVTTGLKALQPRKL